MFPEVDHIQPDARMIVPIHEQACTQQDAGDVSDGGGPIAERGNQHDGEDDVDDGGEDINQAASLVPVLGALYFDAGVLCQGNHDGQDHNDGEPVGVPVFGAGPDLDEVLTDSDEPPIQEPKQDHLVAADSCHQFGEDTVIIMLGDDTVDHGHEHVGHGGTHGEEDVPDLHGDSEHRHSRGTGHSAQQEIGHVVVDQVENLIQENPEAEYRDCFEHRPLQPGKRESHPQLADCVNDIHQQQDCGDGQLRDGNADRSHTKE